MGLSMVFLVEISSARPGVARSFERKQEPSPPILLRSVFWQASAWGLAWRSEVIPLGYW